MCMPTANSPKNGINPSFNNVASLEDKQLSSAGDRFFKGIILSSIRGKTYGSYAPSRAEDGALNSISELTRARRNASDFFEFAFSFPFFISSKSEIKDNAIGCV